MQMHPYLNALLAAEHAKDMRAQGSRERRARAARRARRGTDVTYAVPAQIQSYEPCSVLS
jgi:hypothetical protein